MSRSRRSVVLTAFALSASACYHQVVQTGRTPSSTVVDKAFVSTWLWGLVPAQPIDVRQQCPTGIAVIETETSFVNGLVGALTLGIYTPQHVRVTCASSSAMLPSGAREIRIPVDASPAERIRIVDRAVEETIETHTPTILRF